MPLLKSFLARSLISIPVPLRLTVRESYERLEDHTFKSCLDMILQALGPFPCRSIILSIPVPDERWERWNVPLLHFHLLCQCQIWVFIGEHIVMQTWVHQFSAPLCTPSNHEVSWRQSSYGLKGRFVRSALWSPSRQQETAQVTEKHARNLSL